jgi:hypothetical protein
MRSLSNRIRISGAGPVGGSEESASHSLTTMLFVRDFTGFRGGHLKVFDYYNHVAASRRIRPLIYMTERSLRDATNPWYSAGIEPEPTIAEADFYFVAGLDWVLLDNAGIDLSSKPVINLIQAFGPADPNNFRYQYLRRKALRICVGDELTAAVRKTGRANGEVICIPNGIDLLTLTQFVTSEKRRDVFIAGLKNPSMATQISQALVHRGLDVDVSVVQIAREDFLLRLAAARIALLLPEQIEAFPLFALEAMAVGTAVVIPDCVGNRSYCLNDETSVMPPYDETSLMAAVTDLCADSARQRRLVQNGLATARAHSLDRERQRFLLVLDSLLHV